MDKFYFALVIKKQLLNTHYMLLIVFTIFNNKRAVKYILNIILPDQIPPFRLYIPSLIICCFAFPAVIPWYCWGEDGYVAFFVCGILRYVTVLNFTWCVNSVAHMWGNKPYDKNISPVESLLVTGEEDTLYSLK